MRTGFDGKVRPHTQELPNQKHAAKAYISGHTFYSSGFVVDELCYIESAGGGKKHEAVAVLGDKSVKQNVVLLSRALKEAAGLDLEGNHVSQYVFAGSVINDVIGQGPKRSFKVESVNGLKGHVARVSKTTKVRVVQGDDEEESDFGLAPRKLELGVLPCMTDQLADIKFFFDGYGIEADRTSACCMSIEGSEGTGKTMLLNHIASSNWGKVIRVKPSDKAATIESYFDTAISSERQTLIIMDDFAGLLDRGKTPVLDALSDGFERLATETQRRRRRPNLLTFPRYFYTRVTLPIPDTAGRKEIIRYHEPRVPQDCFEEFVSALGDQTHAYTGADLWELIVLAERAMHKRTHRSPEEKVSWEDIKYALAEVPPTAMHDVTLKPPTVNWSDIGGYNDVKQSLQRVIKRPKPEQTLIHKPPKGVMLYGPPGCSKTMTAQAMATESGFNFFAVKGGELLNMYVGETERSIRNLFRRAREASPSIIFFDEIDSLAGSRSGPGGSTSGGGVQAVTTLLTEMDGFEQLGDVFVLAATNRPDALDPALLRPGRFDVMIYVPLPDEKAREAIFSNKAKELNFKDIDAAKLAKQSEGYSGAELAQICNGAFSDHDYDNDGPEPNYMEGVEQAIRNAPKGVTREMLNHFEQWHDSRRNNVSGGLFQFK
ncbi:P-loop containing nucleoside triphosphate hydrolase protein [Apiospora hydei]|uniref:P-loop containing nucleoside triphosphate hydrolase protein n=1 Tax=Apiospora hydei TaxID=1337664 RepID=A0ABR1WET3_9PEZI